MNREKVIKGVHDARRYLEDREWVNKSVGVHIDALNDAIAIIKEQEEEIENIKQACQSMMEGICLLKEQEAVEPKTGHWIWLQFCANEGVYCSECHTKMFDRYPMKKKLSQFCGHCGAKMVDEVEGR